MEAAGPLRLGPPIDASLSRSGRRGDAGPVPRRSLDPSGSEALGAALGALRSMGLVDDFAPCFVFVGHEARVTNDAQASLLQCRACGGHDGAVDARALAQLLNESLIHRGLAERDLDIRQDTVLVAGVHDTTSDGITLFDGDPVGEGTLPALS